MAIQIIRLEGMTTAPEMQRILNELELLNQPPLSNQRIWWECQTAIQEWIGNILRYGHRELPPETPIEIEVTRTDEFIEIRVWDRGFFFDLAQQISQQSDLDQNFQVGGRGLKIIEKVADKIDYFKTDDSRNCFLLIKYV